MSVLTRPGSTNKNASFVRTSDIITRTFILRLTVNTIIVLTNTNKHTHYIKNKKHVVVSIAVEVMLVLTSSRAYFLKDLGILNKKILEFQTNGLYVVPLEEQQSSG